MPRGLRAFKEGVMKLHIKYMSTRKGDKIFLSRQRLDNEDYIYKKVVLHLGYWKKEISVEYVEDLPEDTIGLSENMIKDFSLPEDVPYKVRFENRNIYIGPVIGLLIVSKHKVLTLEFLDKYKPYLFHYNDVRGLIFIGSSEGINIDNQTMKGYYYRPHGDESWVEGVFPYPNALYKRTGISDEKHEDLIKHIGDNIFNSYFFNKWELWECLSPYSTIREHLPHTEKLTDIHSLDKMMNLYGDVYLKKISGEKSRGMYKVHKSAKGYHFTDRAKSEKIFLNLKESSSFLERIKNKNGAYIIQQAIKLKTFENRSFDMRVVLQKDENKQWVRTSIITRFGGAGSVASNIAYGGFAMEGKEAIQKVFDMKEREVFMMEQEIINVCKKACEALNQSLGHYGDLGIDVVIDENKKVWILEINKLHYHPYPVYALKDRLMYFNTASTPLKYANALTGF
jgi:hypothetical protein